MNRRKRAVNRLRRRMYAIWDAREAHERTRWEVGLPRRGPNPLKLYGATLVRNILARRQARLKTSATPSTVAKLQTPSRQQRIAAGLAIYSKLNRKRLADYKLNRFYYRGMIPGSGGTPQWSPKRARDTYRAHHQFKLWHDRRRWSPDRDRIQDVSGRQQHELEEPGKFKYPKLMQLCIRRKRRREVLHALGKTGLGSRSLKRRYNEWSQYSCRG